MAPEDAGDYLAIRASGRQWELPSWVAHYRLTPEEWPDFRAAVRDALGDGPLTVPELGERLSRTRAYRHLRPVFDDGAGTLVKPLCWQGDVSLGARRDGQLTLQRLDSNPRWTGIPPLAEAGPRAVTAYLRTYGPAPLDNLRYWLGKCLSAGRRLDSWVADLGDRLVAVDIEGTRAYAAREDVGALVAAEPSKAVRFLPGHDQWVMGGSTSDTHVTPPPLRDLMTRKANPVVLGGVVSGTWTHRGGDLVVDWLAEGRRPARAIELETERVAAISQTT
jgi:hypothetical protein